MKITIYDITVNVDGYFKKAITSTHMYTNKSISKKNEPKQLIHFIHNAMQ